MNLLLISNTSIIKQIFNLVTKKLDISLSISDINISHKMFDIIIIEDKLLNDKFPLKEYAKRMGIITKNTILYNQKVNFTLSKPFLPSQLSSILATQIHLLKKELDKNKQTIIKSQDKIDETQKEVNDSIDFIESLADNISDNIIEESDESIVNTAFIENGGILDTNELDKIQDLLSVNNNISDNKTNSNDDNDWVDLSQIIDKAIDEVREYNFNIDIPIKLILNKYSMKELSPLLTKLDQGIIDALTQGKEISLQLRVDIDEK
jgi:hypothetical protein